MYSKPKIVFFATLDNNDTIITTTKSSNESSNNVKQDKTKYSKDDNINKLVQVKIIVPMEDKKNATKIKIMAMLKGQIKSEIGDRFHACVIGQELYPPEGSECEKRIIKHLINPILWQLDNSLQLIT